MEKKGGTTREERGVLNGELWVRSFKRLNEERGRTTTRGPSIDLQRGVEEKVTRKKRGLEKGEGGKGSGEGGSRKTSDG